MQTKHVHKYRRHRYKTGNAVYFCALPDCNVKTLPALALGKKCICWRCEKEFQLNEYSIRLAKPHCDDCHKPKDPLDLDVRVKLVMPDHSLELLKSKLSGVPVEEAEDDI